MKTLTAIEWLVLNETLDDAESLEQIYRALAFELSEGDSQSHAPNPYYWRESKSPILLLADIADAIKSLVAKKLLIVCQDPAETLPPEDLSYVWRSWFQASSEGRALCASKEPMHIRRASPTDREVLLDIWLRSVRATHTFVSEEDIQSFIPLVRDYLASSEPEFWVLCSDSEGIMGFMGMSGSKIDALFLAPEFHRRGGGRRLVRHAQELKGELTVDVNEQNPAARRFYEACGFVVEGRSELDDTGRPYPLLHMRLAAPNPALHLTGAARSVAGTTEPPDAAPAGELGR